METKCENLCNALAQCIVARDFKGAHSLLAPWYRSTIMPSEIERMVGLDCFDLWLKAGEGIARVFYCTVVDRRIVMLHHFVKKSQKTPRKEFDTARRRLKEVNDG